MKQVSEKYLKRITSKSGLVKNQTFAEFECECGSRKEMYLSAGLKAIKCKECYSTKQNLSNTRLYRIWHNMKERCENPVNLKFKYYGGKGVTVCDRWQDFSMFYTDNVDMHTDSLTIDRINSNSDYSPENTEWVTQAENNARANNKRVNQYDRFTGELLATYESAKSAGQALGLKKSETIVRAARGERRLGSGFIWKYLQDITDDWVIPIDSVTGSNTRNKSYKKLSLEGELLATYNSMNILLEANPGTKQVSISKYIRNGKTTGHKGFHWEAA